MIQKAETTQQSKDFRAAIEYQVERSRRKPKYITHPALMDAFEISVFLGRPLLITGGPGTGKSSFANHISQSMFQCDANSVNIKSTTTAKDLFYTVDHIARFSDSHNNSTSSERDVRNYINFTGLGQAILDANEYEKISHFFPPGNNACSESKHELSPAKKRAAKQSVVLIDEIDKAPRDVPNDLLNEFAEFKFSVKEIEASRTGERDLADRTRYEVKASAENKPIVIMTSNSEQMLPDAFLRRCIFYNMPYPKDGTLRKIIYSHLGRDLPEGINKEIQMLSTAMQSGELSLGHTPGTSEWIDFSLIIARYLDRSPDVIPASLKDIPDWKKYASVTLFKLKSDFDESFRALDEIISEP